MSTTADGAPAPRDNTYNDQLFSAGLRSWFHFARFKWLQAMCRKYRPPADLVVEVGCFDGRALDWLDPHPARYYGFDANWGDGLTYARALRPGAHLTFVECQTGEDLRLGPGEKASLVISLETLEHVPPEALPGYLDRMAEILNGHLFVSVPNEKGPFFLAKHLVKLVLFRDAEPYTLAETVWATLGRLDKVKRREHKGFDYAALRAELDRRFDFVEVRGIPFSVLPLWMNSQVGFVYRSRPEA